MVRSKFKFKNIKYQVFYRHIRLNTFRQANCLESNFLVLFKNKKLKKFYKKTLKNKVKYVFKKIKQIEGGFTVSKLPSYKYYLVYNGKFKRKIQYNAILSKFIFGSLVITRKPFYYPFKTKRKKLLI